MKAVLELPDDLARELEQHARRRGRGAVEDLARLVRLALLIEDLPNADLQRVMAVLRGLQDIRNRSVDGIPAEPGKGLISMDAATGLPVIDSPPDAPIRSMTNQQILTMIEQTQVEEDIDRAGVALRQ